MPEPEIKNSDLPPKRPLPPTNQLFDPSLKLSWQ